MSFCDISNNNLQIEKSVQEIINSCIDKNESIVFDSGAGSGKTYALASSIKYVLSKHKERLKFNSQNIICITYTNVATNELNERISYSNLVLISTIHERLWDLISGYQMELVDIHKQKLLSEISVLESEIVSEKFKKYNDYDTECQMKINLLALSLKDKFYELYNLKSAAYREVITPLIGEFSDLLHNVDTFKRLFSIIYKLNSYYVAIDKINAGESNYKKVEYTARINTDRLSKMKISHDTLLEYSYILIEKYITLRKILVHKFPYIFVDEYQDSSSYVVKILNLLSNTAKDINYPMFVGYFGDSVQSIYDNGVGDKLQEYHVGLKRVKKEFNRRSSKNIIGAINKIRNDDIKQISIYEDSDCGCLGFYQGENLEIQNFVNKCISEWDISNQNKLYCLVLTNKIVAEQVGIGNLYRIISKMPRYTGVGYENIKIEFLGSDISKLGYIQRIIYELVEFYLNMQNSKLSVEYVFKNQDISKLNISQLRELLADFKNINVNNLREYLVELILIFNSTKSKFCKDFILMLFAGTDVSINSLSQLIIENWSTNSSDGDLGETASLIDELLDVEMDEIVKWYKLVQGEQEGIVNYYTYHGTKGLEFDNVLIIMENAFGRDKNYFRNFYQNYNTNSQLTVEQLEKYRCARNLLYVSCSRAVKNLRIYYLDDICDFKESIDQIFSLDVIIRPSI